MKITPQCVAALTWTLSDTLGEELDTLDEPVEFLLGGRDLLESIEAALQGHGADGQNLALGFGRHQVVGRQIDRREPPRR